MTGFILGAALLVLAVLAMLLWPLRPGRAVNTAPTSAQLNAQVLRDHLAQVDRDVAEGQLSPEDATAARAELQRRALEDVTQPAPAAPAAPPRRTMAAIALAVPVAAVALYAWLGNPAGLAPPPPAGELARADIERMVANLAQKLESEPGNPQGWVMLARSYMVLGRTTEAERAFERAGSFVDTDPNLLATYADVAATNAGGKLAGKPAALIAKALKADPDNGIALWLAGTEALQRNDAKAAVALWTRLAPQIAAGSEDARNLQGAIDEARARAGLPPGPVAFAGAAPGPSAAAPGASAAASAAVIQGTVTLAPALRDKAAPGDTLLVIARVPGSRMPVAVLRVPASAFPLRFTLDDANSMSPQARLSAAGEVNIEARISKSGQAMPEPGDLISEVQKVKVGAKGVTLAVDKVRP